MPDKRTTQKARKDMRAGKSASTAAGEFVHREISQIRKGKHGAKNAKQAIAIGLSEARRAGVPVRDKGSSSRGRSSSRSRSRSGSSSRAARSTRKSTRSTSATRSRAALKALRRMPRRSASHLALSRQAHRSARSRPARSRSTAARKAARTRAQRGR